MSFDEGPLRGARLTDEVDEGVGPHLGDVDEVLVAGHSCGRSAVAVELPQKTQHVFVAFIHAVPHGGPLVGHLPPLQHRRRAAQQSLQQLLHCSSQEDMLSSRAPGMPLELATGHKHH